MNRRIVTFLLVALLLCLLAGPPAAAGTTAKDNPASSFGQQVFYTDDHVNPPPAVGYWATIYQGDRWGYGNGCQMDAKWGTLFTRGFLAYKYNSRTSCMWGGVRLTYLFQGHPYTIVSGNSPNDWCVATSTAPQIPNCVQLSDGSIFMQAPANDSPTIQAEFITCAGGRGSLGFSDYDCKHTFYTVNF